MSPSSWHPSVRRAVYIVLTVVGLAYGTGMAYLGGTGAEPPPWLVGAGAAYAYLAAATGLIAATNTPVTRAGQDAQHEVDALGGADAWPARARDDDGDGVPDVTPDEGPWR